MKILLGEQIKQADKQTIINEPIESIGLMERASEAMAQWMCNNVAQENPLCFFVGKGGNGGDGLAMLRMLYNAGYECCLYMVFGKKLLSEECKFNLSRLPKGVSINYLAFGEDGSLADSNCINLPDSACVIDAVLGSGFRGELSKEIESIVQIINALPNRVISLDLPSGMSTEWNNGQGAVVKADATLAIEFPKLSCLLPEKGENAGKIEVIPIDLDVEYINSAQSGAYFVDQEMIRPLLASRAKFAHKGDFGHLLLICGSEGMAGAAVLSVGSALRSGAGLVTIHLPSEERFAIYATNPSAMVSGDKEGYFSSLPADIARYTAVGVGCGLGKHQKTRAALRELLLESMSLNLSMVIDADALNIIAEDKSMLELIPSGSILTPHLGELERLVGEWESDQHKIELVMQLSQQIDSYIVVKGAHTMIVTPDGELYFNSTGCAGMAKAGSGDVLMGYISGLMARGYDSLSAAIIGVYFHGKAGEKASEYYGAEGVNSGDIVDMIAEASAEFE
ncbi:MAG: NAD(P)H-hydrate dehydratase [Rikenellaceae bacterium]